MIDEETQIAMVDSDADGVRLLIHAEITIPWKSLYQTLDIDQGHEPVEVNI